MDTVLKRKKPDLIRWFRSSGQMILQYVDSQDLITIPEYTRLKHIQDVDQRHTELLDIILLKGPSVCGQFLDLLRNKEVNESSPELREWVDTVKTSGPSVAPEAQNPSADDHSNTTSSHARNQRIADNQSFLETNRSALVSNVKNIINITDDLSLTKEMRAIVEAQKTDQAKMRKVLEFTNSTKAAELLVRALWKYAADVMEDLTKAREAKCDL